VPYSVIPVPPAQPQDVSFSNPETQPWNLSSLSTPFHETYHPLDDIYSFFDQLVAQFPGLTRRVDMGRTAEGRKIVGISLSTGTYGDVPGGAKTGKGRNREMEVDRDDDDDDDEEEVQQLKKKKKKKKKNKKSHRPPLRDSEKLGFVIIGAQHAREVRHNTHLPTQPQTSPTRKQWVATSTAIYLAHSLLVNQTAPNSLHKLLDHFVNFSISSFRLCPDTGQDFHFVPVPNADGYAYTWQTDRYWYKNRQVVGPYTRCIGLDMNRCVARFFFFGISSIKR
jgi:hypothetical protein